MLVTTGDAESDILPKMCQLERSTLIWPEDWNELIYIPIHKKGPNNIYKNQLSQDFL